MHRGNLFYRLVEQAVTTRPKPIKDFYVTGHRKIVEKWKARQSATQLRKTIDELISDII